MMEFFEMGGYGAYIWPAFAITTIVMVGMALQSFKQLRDAEKELAMLKAEGPARQKAEAESPAQTAAPAMEGKPHEA